MPVSTLPLPQVVTLAHCRSADADGASTWNVTPSTQLVTEAHCRSAVTVGGALWYEPGEQTRTGWQNVSVVAVAATVWNFAPSAHMVTGLQIRLADTLGGYGANAVLPQGVSALQRGMFHASVNVYPRLHGLHSRSDEAVAFFSTNLPTSHIDVVVHTNLVFTLENLPVPQAVQLRSVVGVAEAVASSPAAHTSIAAHCMNPGRTVRTV